MARGTLALARACPAGLLAIALATPHAARADQAPPSPVSPGPSASSPATSPPEREPPAIGAIGAVDPREAIVRRARVAIEDQRYDEALEAVRPLLDQHNERWRAQALEITAEVELILGRAEGARSTLAQLYALAPAFLLTDPSLPPRVTGPFDAEAALPHPRAVGIGLRADAGGPSAFVLLAGGDTDEVVLACRAAGAGPFSAVPTTRKQNLHRFHLPTAHRHFCYAVALDRDGLPLGRLGSPTEPIDLRAEALPAPPPPAPASPPITSRWWFFAGIGAVAAAGVSVAVVVLAHPSTQARPAADLTAVAQSYPAVWSW